MSEKFFANENFPLETANWLRTLGHEVIHAAETLSGASDAEILCQARSSNQIRLTFDRDFGALVFRERQPATRGIVLFRLRQLPPGAVIPFLQSFFEAEPVLAGFFTVASPGQFRQTPLT